ncbi:MAG: hypothetical protein LBS80_05900 [Tannerella sp.]|jgi:hypothetical protein|nr:hypothetical protein [Tannerella sp.]
MEEIRWIRMIVVEDLASLQAYKLASLRKKSPRETIDNKIIAFLSYFSYENNCEKIWWIEKESVSLQRKVL